MDKERRNRGNKIYYSRNDLLTLNKNGRRREREKKWTKKEEIVKIKSTIIAMICEL